MLHEGLPPAPEKRCSKYSEDERAVTGEMRVAFRCLQTLRTWSTYDFGCSVLLVVIVMRMSVRGVQAGYRAA